MSFSTVATRLFAVLFLLCAFAVAPDASAAEQASSAQGAFCAEEDGYCAFSGSRNVYYGANGRYTIRRLNNGTACSNDVFGDPIPGVRKACFVEGAAASSARGGYCADEGGRCSFSGARDVHYGANGRFAVRRLINGADCNNDVFGDPIPGVRKACYVDGAFATPPSVMDQCAEEGGFCRFNGLRDVYYGANGRFVMRRVMNGTACTNDVFGDPIEGVRKGCYVERGGRRR